ncbi:MAG: ABC transporter ATP-binding protein [Gaiellales bacterium]
MAGVSFDHVTKQFGTVTAVDDLSLDIESGEFVVLVGPSGCGKTTALRMLAGLEPVTAGRIRIGERDVERLPPRQRDVAMVFQDYALYPQMSVYKNLAFGLQTRKVPKQEVRRLVDQAAGRLGLDTLLDRKPRQLSGGQRQRVALGRALVRQPQVFLMDEPLSNLDAKLRVDMRAEIKALQRETGVTTVFVTHDQVEAMTMGDRIAVMRAGVLEQLGDPDAVYNRPATVFVASFIGSPAMTFGRFSVTRDNGRVRLRGGGIELEHDGAANATPDEVIAGVRPEHVRPWRSDAGLLGPFSGRVESIEALGRETFVGVRAGDGLEYVVRFDGAAVHQIGEPLEFGIERGRVFLFDPASEAAIGR